VSSTERFHSLAGVECRLEPERDDDDGVPRDVRRTKGVSPVDGIAGPGSENRTRFLDRCGVAGGVFMPRGTV
jgi:hypothetical protein